MAAGTGSSGSCEETLAQLDALQAAERTRVSADLDRLRSSVAGLGVGSEHFPEPATPGPRPVEFRDREVAQQVEYPLLPRRTTHGGPFGASIIDRVAASVAREDAW